MYLDEDFCAFDRKMVEKFMGEGKDPGDAAAEVYVLDMSYPMKMIKGFAGAGMWGMADVNNRRCRMEEENRRNRNE